MPISTDGNDYVYLPQLLKAGGGYFPAMVYVRNFLEPYQRNFPEVTVMANNFAAMAVMGDPQNYIDSLTLEAWGPAAYKEVKAAIGDPSTNGLFTLRIPDVASVPGSASGDTYLIRFYEADFSRTYPRRQGFPQVFTADIENVEVHGHGTFS